MVNLEHCGAEEQDHESGEKPDVRPPCPATAAHTRLAQAFLQQAAEPRFDLAANLPEISNEQFAHGNGKSLSPKPEPPPDAVNKNRKRRHGQAIEQHH